MISIIESKPELNPQLLYPLSPLGHAVLQVELKSQPQSWVPARNGVPQPPPNLCLTGW